MMPAQIIQTSRGFIVISKARDFPSLAELAPFLELRPVGLAAIAKAVQS